ncbi:DUF2249 domain-containing protein [Hydrogenimonas sp.]
MKVLELDVRGLEHPEPLERSVAMFKALGEGEVMHLRIHRYPVPLLQIAQKRGLRFEAYEAGEGDFHILFTQNPDIDLAALLKERAGV